MSPDTAPPQTLDAISRDGGTIEVLQNRRGEIYHRACAKGYCRYCEDRWQAELYLDQLLAR
jgi:hypothetical protein